MTAGNRTFLILIVGLVLIAVVASRRSDLRGRGTAAEGPVSLTSAERDATFHFDPSVSPYDRTAVESAVARARPEARRLVDAVDGLVDLRVEQTEAGSVGTTQRIGSRYDVRLNLGLANRAGGQRGIDRLVLHELGHVVDMALVPRSTFDALVAQVPEGYGCDGGESGGCTAPAERFAETFAKWATGDIGVDIYLGYKIPPPADLQAWGAPLAALAA